MLTFVNLRLPLAVDVTASLSRPGPGSSTLRARMFQQSCGASQIGTADSVVDLSSVGQARHGAGVVVALQS